MKITIIGAGNIGGALAFGLARNHSLPIPDITVTARHPESLEKFQGAGIRTAMDNCEAVRDADIVCLAVKPWQMEAVVREIKDTLDYKRQILVSLAPGIRPEQFNAWFDKEGCVPAWA